MTQYFNVNNQVHVLDDGVDPAEYIKQPYTVITKAEADILLTPPTPTAQQQRDALQAQIDAIELKAIENRKWREYSIIEMEKAAIAYGAAQTPPLDAATSLAYAYATNIAYKKTKDLDVQITALRTQKDAIV